MNELLINIENFKKQIAYDLNNSKLPAEIMRYVLQDFVNVCNQLAQAQLAQAQQTPTKEDENNGNSND